MGQYRVQVDAVGTTIDILVDETVSTDDAKRIAAAWSGAMSGASLPADTTLSAGYVAPVGAVSLDVTGSNIEDLLSRLSTCVTLSAIEAQKSHMVMLHACGVASHRGEVVAFVGPSGRGKTTLATELGRVWGYVTDETVGIDLDGIVHPYRKPLSVVSNTSSVKDQIAPDTLQLLALPTGPLSIAAIVLLDRQADHDGPPVVSEVDLVTALIELAPELSYLSELDRPLQRIAGLIDRVGGVQKIRYSDVSDVPALLHGLVERTPRSSGWEAVTAHETSDEMPGQGFRRRRPLDAIAVDGDYVFLHGSELRVVTGIGPTIWDVLDTPRSDDSIVDAVVDRFGRPEGNDPMALVREALDQLVHSGVLDGGQSLSAAVER